MPDTYPDIILTSEVIELGILKFIDDVKINYIDWNIIKFLTDYMIVFEPLNQNIDAIIEDVMNLLPNNEPHDINTLNKKLRLSMINKF